MHFYGIYSAHVIITTQLSYLGFYCIFWRLKLRKQFHEENNGEDA